MEKEPTELTSEEIIDQKLRDAETPGYEVSFDPDEVLKGIREKRLVAAQSIEVTPALGNS